MENSTEIAQKTKSGATSHLAIPLLGIHPQRAKDTNVKDT